MTDDYEFPTALDDEQPRADTLRWTATVIALATLGLAVLNPGAISGWADDLAPGPLTIRLAAASDAWNDAMTDIGLGAGHAKLHTAWKAAERGDWSGRQPIETADANGPRS